MTLSTRREGKAFDKPESSSIPAFLTSTKSFIPHIFLYGIDKHAMYDLDSPCSRAPDETRPKAIFLSDEEEWETGRECMRFQACLFENRSLVVFCLLPFLTAGAKFTLYEIETADSNMEQRKCITEKRRMTRYKNDTSLRTTFL